MQSPATAIDRQTWLLLILLSVLWGGSFFFVSVALRELPPLTIALVRVALAALLLLPFLKRLGGALPKTVAGWKPFFVMGLLNNVIPFSLIFVGQTYIASGLASVLNATTPLFTVLVLAAFGDERLIARRVVGVLIGLFGVIVLRGSALEGGDQALGMAAVPWRRLELRLFRPVGRRKLNGVPPITSATCQLITSSLVMAVIAAAVDRPWQLPMPGAATWAALIRLGRSGDRARLYRVLYDPQSLRRFQCDAGDFADPGHRHPAGPFCAGRADRAATRSPAR